MSFDNVEYWENWYFIGFTNGSLEEIDYKPETLQTLLNMINIQTVISGLGATTLENLINRKGVTAWHILYVYSIINDKEGVEFVSQEKSQIFIPKSIYQHSDVNWPSEILNKYKIQNNEWQPFIIPFLVYSASRKPTQINTVLSSKDGSRKIFGVFEFSESNPEQILGIAEHFLNVLQNHE